MSGPHSTYCSANAVKEAEIITARNQFYFKSDVNFSDMQQLVLLLHNFLGCLFTTEAHPCRENHHLAVVVSADVIEQYSRAA